MQTLHNQFRLFALALFCVTGVSVARAQSTEFTYQGRLTDGGAAANGSFDLRFILYDVSAGGAQQGGILTREDVTVTMGVFTVQLDFGAVFPGAERWLEIAVRPGASAGIFTVLSPRQLVRTTPYAIRSLNAGAADTLTGACVGCVTIAQIGGVNGGAVNGMIPVASVPAGSGNYVQNTTSPQATSNFNISGNGTAGGMLSANVVNTATQYNIGGSRVLSIGGTANVFAGENAGSANTTGDRNAFFGRSAGAVNITGGSNSFFGSSSGSANTTGGGNAFFGTNAGISNTTASSNSFFGAGAGRMNVTGTANAYFGGSAGESSTTGSNNAMFGRLAGTANTASDNSFFGASAGETNTMGTNNTFIGGNAGAQNTTGNYNTLLGHTTDVSVGNLDHATAIGSGAIVTSGARIQLGRDGIDTVRIGHLSAATATHVCISGNNVLASCSSSQRYKQNVQPLNTGLNLIQSLRPVTFDWKEQQQPDLGLIAEEVAKVEPLLVTHNKAGVIEGVKYDQLSVVLINAVKEQQAQIAAQQKQIEELQKLVCRTQRRVKACQPAQR